MAERARRSFTSPADFAARVALARNELERLAELGALASLEGGPRERREALWQVAALERDAGSLFAGTRPTPQPSPLPELSPLESTLADYRLAGLTTGPHLLAHWRQQLRERGVVSAQRLREVRDGQFVRTAGHVIVRQRPGSAKGFCFLTLEDETGTSNAVLTPNIYERFRIELQTAAVVELAGPLQNVDGVVHVRVQHLWPLEPRGTLPPSHDYR